MNTLPLILTAPAVGLGTYYLTTLVQTVFHRWFGHHRRLDAVYENHANGHHRDYPARRLTTDTWIVAERHVMWYYALPLVPVAALAAWQLPWILFAIHAVVVGLTIWWHLYLHMHYHLNGTPWARFGWFRRKRDLHLRHHLTHHRNFAIVEFFWDRLFGSYDARPPVPPIVAVKLAARCSGHARGHGCDCGRSCRNRAQAGLTPPTAAHAGAHEVERGTR
jgi:sterol desaturase/sphingolipid hydroxylase (fatty acid hydroxylase superfamily)